MPDGKPAGVRCVQLTADLRCAIFGLSERPAVCGTFRPSEEMCGRGADAAIEYLSVLEKATFSG